MQTKEAIEKELRMYQLVKQWQQSGITKIAFCQKHGFTRDMFSYWVNKYEARYQPKQVPAFVPLAIEGTQQATNILSYGASCVSSQTGASALTNTQEIEIRYPNGVRLSLHSISGIDTASLRILVTLI